MVSAHGVKLIYATEAQNNLNSIYKCVICCQSALMWATGQYKIVLIKGTMGRAYLRQWQRCTGAGRSSPGDPPCPLSVR